MNTHIPFRRFVVSSIVSISKICVLAFLFVYVFHTGRADALTNVLENPGFEAGDTSGWTVTGDCPLNFILYGNTDYDSCVRMNSGGHGGSYHVTTSYDWGVLSQEVDLVGEGYSSSTLDAEPDITASVWVIGGSGMYKFKVILRDEEHEEIATYDSGQVNTTTDWQEVSHTFTGYGSGVRYVYFEIQGKDTLFWSGHFGSSFDDASLTIGREVESLGGCSTFTKITGNLVEETKCGVTVSYVVGPPIVLPISQATPQVLDSSATSTNQSTLAVSSSSENTASSDPLATSTSATSTSSTSTTPTLATSTPVSVPGVSESKPIAPSTIAQTLVPTYIFTKYLKVGDMNDEVKELQKYLNTHGFPISSDGPGSLNNETTFFGQKTKNALAKYQKANGIAPAFGIFGPITRSWFNKSV